MHSGPALSVVCAIMMRRPAMMVPRSLGFGIVAFAFRFGIVRVIDSARGSCDYGPTVDFLKEIAEKIDDRTGKRNVSVFLLSRCLPFHFSFTSVFPLAVGACTMRSQIVCAALVLCCRSGAAQRKYLVPPHVPEVRNPHACSCLFESSFRRFPKGL